jgi:4'-phosphopantetheinyl transferase
MTWSNACDWDPRASDASAVDVFRLRATRELGPHSWLSAEESARLARVARELPRRCFLAGRLALRALLSRALACPPEAVTLAIGAHGKPEAPAAAARGIAFNLSHSDDCVLVAIGHAPQLGVDVERARARGDLERLARRVLTAEERARLPGTEPERLAAFHRHWVAKEAYLKAWGRGLSFAPSRCAIRLEGGVSLAATEMPGDAPERWRFAELDAGAGFAACVCWPGDERTVRCWQIEPGALAELAGPDC